MDKRKLVESSVIYTISDSVPLLHIFHDFPIEIMTTIIRELKGAMIIVVGDPSRLENYGDEPRQACHHRETIYAGILRC